MNIIKDALQRHKRTLVSLARASELNSARVSLFLNYRLKPVDAEIEKMGNGLAKLGMDPALAKNFQDNFNLRENLRGSDKSIG